VHVIAAPVDGERSQAPLETAFAVEAVH
jgi:hypothetical protein